MLWVECQGLFNSCGDGGRKEGRASGGCRGPQTVGALVGRRRRRRGRWDGAREYILYESMVPTAPRVRLLFHQAFGLPAVKDRRLYDGSLQFDRNEQRRPGGRRGGQQTIWPAASKAGTGRALIGRAHGRPFRDYQHVGHMQSSALQVTPGCLTPTFCTGLLRPSARTARLLPATDQVGRGHTPRGGGRVGERASVLGREEGSEAGGSEAPNWIYRVKPGFTTPGGARGSKLVGLSLAIARSECVVYVTCIDDSMSWICCLHTSFTCFLT